MSEAAEIRREKLIRADKATTAAASHTSSTIEHTQRHTHTHTHVYKLDAIHCKTSIHAADNIYVQFSDKFIDYFAVPDLCCCIQTHTTHCVMPVTLQHKGVQSNKAMTVISRTKLITVNGWWQKIFSKSGVWEKVSEGSMLIL